MTQAPSLTATLMAARSAQGLSFADPGAAMGRDELLIALLFHSQSTASEPEAPQRIDWPGLDPSMGSVLKADPTKGCLDPVIPTDPSIYCFYKMIQEYEIALKDVIQSHATMKSRAPWISV